MAPTACVPGEHVCQTGACPSGPSSGQAEPHPSQKDGGVPQSAVCSALGVILPGIISPVATVLWDPGMQDSPRPGPPPLTPPPPCNHSKAVKGLPFAATKPRAPDVCKAVLQETGTGAPQRVSGEPVPACLLGALGRVAVSPRCGSLGGCPMQSGDGPADLTEIPHSWVCAACSALGVGAAEELGLHWLQSCGTHGCEPDWPRARRGGGVPWQQSQNRDATPGCELCSG